ncbi:MAG: SDR family NAD(P)-dependent oxidoreductase [Ignavibacteriae bacterium]|nr:SDR family NAD(P)-dependent oxidoreductase [Ignavibacteriota bacterium]
MQSLKEKIVCITGASSGIGAACAEEFAKLGCHLMLLARRRERIENTAQRLATAHGIKTFTAQLDVRKQKEVEQFFHWLPEEWQAIDILVNNAGLARGLAKLHEGNVNDWEEMIDTNVKGLLYVSRAVLPSMVERNRGHVINIGSIAGHQTYPMGNVYCATKFAVVGITRGLKMDLLGTAVRVSSVDPGLVETEFSQVRFHGDTERASKAYAGLTPLTPHDVAQAVVFCATRPPHVNIGELTLTPTDQATVNLVHRRT